MLSDGLQAGKSLAGSELFSAVSKLRKRETLSFRPDNDDQDKLIHDAQKATGIKMSELLRLSCLRGLPSVVADVQQQQQAAFQNFAQTLRETHVDVTVPETAIAVAGAKPDPSPYKISRKQRKPADTNIYRKKQVAST